MGKRPTVVVVGAGFGGLAAARRLERERVDVVIVDRHNFHTFLPLLYQVATADLNSTDVAHTIRGVFRYRRRVRFRKGAVVGVDWQRRHVLLRDEPPLGFDYLIIAAGSTNNTFGIPGADDYGFPLYSLEDAISLRNHILSLFEAAAAMPDLIDDGILNFVVVGGGPTGVELSGALAELVDGVLQRDYHDLNLHKVQVTLIEQADELLGAFHGPSRQYARAQLQRRGVEVRTATTVTEISHDQVCFADGSSLRTRCVVFAAGVRANDLAASLNVAQGSGGRIKVGPDLSLPGYPEAFAIGDIAHVDDREGGPLPQLAQVAIQGGDHAAEQILGSESGASRRPFHYHDKGIMATIGRNSAVAELPGGPRLRGRVAWLAWLGLHLIYLLGIRNRISVMFGWMWRYIFRGGGPRLILRPETLPQTPHPHSEAPSPGIGIHPDRSSSG